MLIFDLLLYVIQCYTDCRSYLYLNICYNTVVYLLYAIRNHKFRFCNNIDKNVNCPDTVGILEIIYVLRVNIVADQSSFCCEAVKLQSVSYGCFEPVCRQQDKSKLQCMFFRPHCHNIYKRSLSKKVQKNFNFKCLVSFKFRNAKVTDIHTCSVPEITGE
jgi:hypothetical protein